MDSQDSALLDVGSQAPSGAFHGQSCRIRILIVDDEPAFLRAMGRRLRPHHVVLVSSVPDGIAVLDERSYDVILCDVNLPDVRGVGLYEYLQRVYPGEEARVVFMTGGTLRPGPRAYLSVVPNPVLRKPISEAVLSAAIAQALATPALDRRRVSAGTERA
jgi:CheY-like chemotaxis protein